MKPIGEIIGEYRNRTGATQVQIAAMAGIDQATVSRLQKRTECRPIDPQAMDTFRGIARAFGLPLDHFPEVRVFQVQQLVGLYPDLVDTFYEGLIEGARVRARETGDRRLDHLL